MASSGSLDKQLPLRVQLENSSDLRSNPLKNFKSGAQPTTQPASLPKAQNAAPQPGQPKDAIKCNMELLYLDGEELSFEELRAARQPYFEDFEGIFTSFPNSFPYRARYDDNYLHRYQDSRRKRWKDDRP